MGTRRSNSSSSTRRSRNNMPTIIITTMSSNNILFNTQSSNMVNSHNNLCGPACRRIWTREARISSHLWLCLGMIQAWLGWARLATR